MKAEIVPSNGADPIPITRDVTVVGRREFCDVQIDHPSLSKRHCIIVRTDGLLMVRDLATTNGTKVNGQKILWAALLPNDRLTLGRCKFRVYLGSDDAPSPSERAKAAPVSAASTGPAKTLALGFPSTTPSGRGPAPKPSTTGTDDDVPELVGPDDLVIEDDSDEGLEILSD
jgi:predicted component of type VI protein secretion system